MAAIQPWFAPDSGTGDNSSMVSDFSTLPNIHPAFLATPLAQHYHAWLIRHVPYPMGPAHPRADLPGNQPHPLQADLFSVLSRSTPVCLRKALSFPLVH